MTTVALPIDALRERVAETATAGPLVVTAPTGSGKSTEVPRWLLAQGRRVLVIEPRRVACRSLARWVARLEGTSLGDRVGYAVRHEEAVGPRTSLTYATTGVVLRRVQDSGSFGEVDAVVLDEAHERSIEVDLLLSLLKAAPIPVKIVMSATLDAEAIARWLGGTALRCEGRSFPVEVLHRGENVLPDGRRLPERVRAAVEEASAWPGDILVFLPGKKEIGACATSLRGLSGLETVPLHAGLPREAQDRAFEPGERRRVVLATNVAETSVTLPRIGVVVDSGLVRRTEYRDGRGVLRLGPVALDAAEQRAGRAGRLMPGRCVRLWHPGARLAARTPPELLREGLDRAALVAASCGRPLAEMDLLDPPPAHAAEEATRRLWALGAVRGDGRLSETGRAMAALPLDPAFARVVCEARRSGEGVGAVVDLVSALQGGRRLLRPARDEETARAQRELAGEPGCDATALVNAVRHGEPDRHGLDPAALCEARRVARQLRRRLGLPGRGEAGDAAGERAAILAAFARGLPASVHVPRRRGSGWTCGGAEVALARESFVAADSEALVVLDTHSEAAKGRSTRTVATAAMPCSRAALRRLGVGVEEPRGSVVRGGVLVTTVARRVAHVVLDERDAVLEGRAAVREAARTFAEGRLGPRFAGLAEEGRERLSARALYARLAGHGAGAPPRDLEAWAAARLEELGFSSGQDVALLAADDLRVPDLSEDERAWLDSRFPRHLDLGDARCDVRYDPARRTVTVERIAGRRKDPPPLAYLPAWSGWRVVYKDRNVVRVLRG